MKASHCLALPDELDDVTAAAESVQAMRPLFSFIKRKEFI
jgi:hypothetical protein